MAYLPTAAEYQGDMLVVREDWLQRYLAAQGVALAYLVRGERDHLDDSGLSSWTEFSLSGSYDAGTLSARISVITPKRTARAS